MTDEELKAIWKASNERMQDLQFNNLNLNIMNQAIKRLEQRITRRNNLEITFAIIIIAVFLVFAYREPSLIAKIGAVFLIIYELNVIYHLRKTESKQPNFDVTKSLKIQLSEYQSYIKEERKLLKNVAYWYLLPMLPGMILFLMGTVSKPIYALLYFVFVGLVFIGVYRINQRAVRINMNPLIEDIDKALVTLEETTSETIK